MNQMKDFSLIDVRLDALARSAALCGHLGKSEKRCELND
jgi:hypothetical protein